MTILVTGSAGFIGSNFVFNWLESCSEKIIGIDKLTYAGNLKNFADISDNPLFAFYKADIGDSDLIEKILSETKPRAIVNFAAETNVDRSIDLPDPFIETNICGTYKFINQVLKFYKNINQIQKKKFRFIHISTDEVYGSLKNNIPFKESDKYSPNNPYSASKASSDHLVRAWSKTYNLPILIIHCSNNYGPFQFHEKFIPTCILRALKNLTLPLYGDGFQVRDWLYVTDNIKAIMMVLNKGIVGHTYNIGCSNGKTNLEVATKICNLLDQLRPRDDGESYNNLISFVRDRPGHDRRYLIDASKITEELGWRPEISFDEGILKTVQWYLNNIEWTGQFKSNQENI